MQHHRATILLVDDDTVALEALRALLHRSYSLAVARSGTEALAIAASADPDLVLLDVLIPDINGLEVCRRLRQDDRLAEVPVILLTSLDDRAARLAGIEAGADDFITKPFDRVELLARVQAITRLNRYRRLVTERTKYELLVNRSPDGIAVVDGEQRIVLANPALCRLVGVAPGALAGWPLARIVTPEHADQLAGLLLRAAADGPDARADALLRRADGSLVSTEVTAGAFVDEGRPLVQVIVRDVTERRRAELELEVERRRVAYDLHDGLAQLGVSALRQLEIFAERHHPEGSAARAELEYAADLIGRVTREARRIIAGLRPNELDDFGLAVALHMQVDALRAGGMRITLDEELEGERLPLAVETALFWVAQEALTNVRKHAAAERVQVVLARGASAALLTVQDWGVGFDPAQAAGGGLGDQLGLLSMRERVAVVGGRCTITSAPGAGTLVSAEVPIPAAPGAGEARL